MINYEEIKAKLKHHKQAVVYAGCAVVIFLIGCGTGQATKQNDKRNAQSINSNYTTPSKNAQTDSEQNATPLKPNGQVGQTAGVTAPKGECVVKGNISSKGEKIYHIKGGAFYDRTNPEQCFQTEAEAQAAGFRKSSR
jgi:hypothetical protein